MVVVSGIKESGYIGNICPKVDSGINRITDSTTIAEAESKGYVHLTVDEARQLLRNRRK